MHFVFQGGGAKLVPLIAAADAVVRKSKEYGFPITSSSGTSAGAIAAAMIAFEIDPKHFRSHLISIADEYFERIVCQNSFKLACRLFTGAPLYDAVAYREFLTRLFSIAAPSTHLSDAKMAINIHATDIKNANAQIYDKTKNDSIVDALFDSSAIPFVFNTHRSKRQYIDGGVINNFPASNLMALANSQDVIGFSFHRNTSQTYDAGLFQYVQAIINTAVDYPVRTAVDALGQNVCHLVTSLGTLDFYRAIEHLKDDAIYSGYRLAAEDFINRFLAARKVSASPPASPAPTPTAANSRRMLASFNQFHTSQHANVRYEVLKKVFEYECRTLASGKFDVTEPQDAIQSVEEIRVTSGMLSTYGQTLLANNKTYDLGDLSFRIYNKNAPSDTISAEAIVLPPEHSSGVENFASLLLLLHKPIKAQIDGPPWIISYSCRADEPLSYLSKPGHNKDSWLFTNIIDVPIKLLEAVFLVPASLPSLTMSEWQANDRPLGSIWVNGRSMTTGELNAHRTPPPGYKAIGWRAENLPPGGAVGFLARLNA